MNQNEIDQSLQQNSGMQMSEEMSEVDGMTPEMAAMMSVQQAQNYMADNISYADQVRTGTGRMTKAELAKQKAKEAGTFPTAPRMSEFEKEDRVAQLSDKVDKLTEVMMAFASAQAGLTPPASTESPVQTEPENSESQPHPDVPMMLGQNEESTLLNQSQNESNESQNSTSRVALGPAQTNQNQEALNDDESIISESDDYDDEALTLQALPLPSGENVDEQPENNPKAEAAVELAESVHGFFKVKDPLRRFRKIIASLHRHVEYNSWTPEMRAEFDARFANLLNDSVFLINQCRKIVDMQHGHAVAAPGAASLIVAVAGFMAFGLIGT